MKKNRKVGTPKRKRRYPRGDTPTRDITINLPPGLDFLSQARAEDVLDIIAEPQKDERFITLNHHIPTWDDPPDTTARAIVINTRTKETRHFIKRGANPTWLLKVPGTAEQRANMTKQRHSTESPKQAYRN